MLIDPETILRLTPRSFAIRVPDQSMLEAGIRKGDIVVGEFTPEAGPGAIVVALNDGEPAIRRLVSKGGRLQLASENGGRPNLIPLSELVIQGVVHTIVHRLKYHGWKG